MSLINACSACFLRDSSRKCCYNTCSLFLEPDRREDCKRQCDKCSRDRSAIDIAAYRPPQHFKECLPQFTQFDDALDCCLQKCGKSLECQENCIDAYNAIVPADGSVFPRLLGRFRSNVFEFFSMERKEYFIFFFIVFLLSGIAARLNTAQPAFG